MQALDPRIVQVSLEVNGKIKTYSDIAITASGTKYANSLQNEANISLTNLNKQTQDYILTETTPINLNRTPKVINLYAGRKSYGTTKIYSGNIISANVSQPPDITVTLKCLTGNFLKGSIISNTQLGAAPLSSISKKVAQDVNAQLDFQATDKNISNYSFSGSSIKQLDYLSSTGNIDVFLDNDILVVKGQLVALNNSTRVLDENSGMIGIPEFTEQGLRVKFLLDNKTRVGGGLQIKSYIYPSTNGNYVIYKLSFEITNRDTPFYYIADCVRRA